MKKCYNCKTHKPLSEYHKRTRSKDGHENICKKCKKECNKQYRENNPDKIRRNNYKFRKNNPGKVKEYREKHRGKTLREQLSILKAELTAVKKKLAITNRALEKACECVDSAYTYEMSLEQTKLYFINQAEEELCEK